MARPNARRRERDDGEQRRRVIASRNARLYFSTDGPVRFDAVETVEGSFDLRPSTWCR